MASFTQAITATQAQALTQERAASVTRGWSQAQTPTQKRAAGVTRSWSQAQAPTQKRAASAKRSWSQAQAPTQTRAVSTERRWSLAQAIALLLPHLHVHQGQLPSMELDRVATLTLPGFTSVPPLTLITGPCTDPWLEVSGIRMTWKGVTLAFGELLIANHSTRTTTLRTSPPTPLPNPSMGYQLLQPGANVLKAGAASWGVGFTIKVQHPAYPTRMVDLAFNQAEALSMAHVP